MDSQVDANRRESRQSLARAVTSRVWQLAAMECYVSALVLKAPTIAMVKSVALELRPRSQHSVSRRFARILTSDLPSHVGRLYGEPSLVHVRGSRYVRRFFSLTSQTHADADQAGESPEATEVLLLAVRTSRFRDTANSDLLVLRKPARQKKASSSFLPCPRSDGRVYHSSLKTSFLPMSPDIN